MTTDKDVVGRAVRILEGPCMGRIGRVTEIATDKHSQQHLRIQFDPPVAIQSAGLLKAVWRKPGRARAHRLKTPEALGLSAAFTRATGA